MKETKAYRTMKRLSTEFNVTEFPFNLYDKDGNVTYHEDSKDGFHYRFEYDSNNNEIYYEDSDKFWVRREYDSNGNEAYYEDSTGVIRGTKKQQCPDTIVINGTIYKKQ